MKKYADLSRSVKTAEDLHSGDRPPWKPTGISTNFNQLKGALSPAAKRHEYDKSLKSRFSTSPPRAPPRLSEGSKENAESGCQLRYRLLLSAVDQVCDKLVFDRLFAGFANMKGFSGHVKRPFRFLKTKAVS